MMSRDKLRQVKKILRYTGNAPDVQTAHALIDHGLETLELIDGGTTLANRNTEIKAGLAELREMLSEIRLHNNDPFGQPRIFGDVAKAQFTLDLVAGMLTTDYRRYSSWAGIRPQIAEEFGE